MSGWIGLGASSCIDYRKIEYPRRTFAIQLPYFPVNCGFADEIEAYHFVMKRLKDMRYTHIILNKDDSILHAAAATGWKIGNVIIRMNTIGVMREQFRWSSRTGKRLYPLYYECGLVYVPGCGWYRVLNHPAPANKRYSEEKNIEYAAKYREIEVMLQSRGGIMPCSMQMGSMAVEYIENVDEFASCLEFLLNAWLQHIQQIFRDEGHPYAFYFDEPQNSDNEQQKMEFLALYNVIQKNIYKGNPLYTKGGDIFTVIANYHTWLRNHLENWAGFADYVFPDYYSGSWNPITGTDSDQRDNWEEDKNSLGDKMSGAFISILEDHIRRLVASSGDGRNFGSSEVRKLLEKAKELNLQNIWVFPGSEGQWKYLDGVFKSKTRCELFLEYAKELCDIQDKIGWIADGRAYQQKVYCRYFPDCSKCKGMPPGSEVWSPIKPKNFPDVSELMDSFGARMRTRLTPSDAMWAITKDYTKHK